jgi:hypothetical protein
MTTYHDDPTPKAKPAQGQIWQDNDPRTASRFLQIIAIQENAVYFTRVHKVDGQWIRFYPDGVNGPRQGRAALVRFGLRSGYKFIE